MKIALFLTLLLSIPSSALALDFTAPLTDFDGKPIPNCPTPAPCDKVLMLGDAAAIALLAPDAPNGPQTAGDEKVKRFQLALKIRGAKDVKLSAEETALIKAQIAKDYPPLIVGRAWALLDPAAAPAK